MVGIQKKIKETITTFRFILSFIVSSIYKKPRTFKIGVFSIFIVVTFLVLLQSALQLTSILFIKLADNQNGQIDLLLSPVAVSSSNSNSSSYTIPTLNLTEISEKLRGLPGIAGISPRWMLPVNVSTLEYEDENYNVIGIILDSKSEREQGIGQGLDAKDLGSGQCWITKSVQELLDLKENEMSIKVDILSALSDLGTTSKNGTDGIIDKIADQVAELILDQNSSQSVLGLDLGSDLQESLATDPTIRQQLKIFLDPLIRETLNITRKCNVIERVNLPEGKWSSSYENVIVFDSKYIASLLVNRFLILLDESSQSSAENENPVMTVLLSTIAKDEQFKDKLRVDAQNFDPNQYALQANILLRDRVKLYSTEDGTRAGLVDMTNLIFDRLGINYPVVISSPVADALDSFFIFKMFLNGTSIAVIFLLALLALLLTYSLMNQSVEEKNYEFGMLRILGLKRPNLVLLLAIQSLIFGIIGSLLGFALAYSINVIISYFIFEYTLLKTSYIFSGSGSATAIGLAVGIVVPFISNIIPIRRVLSHVLRDSLNIYQRTSSNKAAKIMRLTQVGLSLSQIVAALLLIIVGSLSLYLAPYAFIYANSSLFFSVLNLILILTICGVALLANLFQPKLQKLLLEVTMLIACNYKPLKTIITKNFVSHQKRNRKTSLMFTLTLAFLIFASSGLKLDSASIIDQLRVSFGSDIVISSTESETTFLDEATIRKQLEEFKKVNPGMIRGYAFVSPRFGAQGPRFDTSISSIAMIPRPGADIISVDSTYFDSMNDDYYIPINYDPKARVRDIQGTNILDASEALYNQDGLITIPSFDSKSIITLQNLNALNVSDKFESKEVRIIIPESLAKIIATESGMQSIIQINYRSTRARVRNVAKKLPGFTFTGYTARSENWLITSHQDYKLLRDNLWANQTFYQNWTTQLEAYRSKIPEGSSYDVPKANLLVKLESGVSESIRRQLVNSLKPLIKGKFTLLIDIIEAVETLTNTLFFIDVFLIIVSVIALFLSFFFAVVAFVGNVKENLWEFGVLRAIGFSKRQMGAVYILEALCLILSSTILGTVSGLAVALMIAGQFSYWVELPMKFIFPGVIFGVTVGASVLIGIFGSKFAIDEVKRKQIASIIKSAD